MYRLHEIGFQPVGRWILASGSLKIELNALVEHKNVLYAFITDDKVKYVGKTTQALQRRMMGYQRPSEGQRTNWRNHHSIVELLKAGHEVDIMAVPDYGLFKYGAFHLNLAAGLEDSIIKTLNPAWNGGRASTVIETPEESNPPEQSAEAKLEAEVITSSASFPLTVQETYYRTGFFNVPIAFSSMLAGDMADVTIYCGDEKLVVNAKISRTATQNGSPRIRGGAPLKTWFRTGDPMRVVTVRILNPTTLYIQE